VNRLSKKIKMKFVSSFWFGLTLWLAQTELTTAQTQDSDDYDITTAPLVVYDPGPCVCLDECSIGSERLLTVGLVRSDTGQFARQSDIFGLRTIPR
jgi:hypothetical protein